MLKGPESVQMATASPDAATATRTNWGNTLSATPRSCGAPQLPTGGGVGLEAQPPRATASTPSLPYLTPTRRRPSSDDAEALIICTSVLDQAIARSEPNDTVQRGPSHSVAPSSRAFAVDVIVRRPIEDDRGPVSVALGGSLRSEEAAERGHIPCSLSQHNRCQAGEPLQALSARQTKEFWSLAPEGQFAYRTTVRDPSATAARPRTLSPNEPVGAIWYAI